MSAPALSGPLWLAVRTQRRVWWTALALLALPAGILLYERLSLGAEAAAITDPRCLPRVATADTPGVCRTEFAGFWDTQYSFHVAATYVAGLMVALPPLIGAFVAGPLIGRELESGTYKPAWTQSVSPARWLLAKLAVPAGWTVLVVSALAGLFHWAWSTGRHPDYPERWYEPVFFHAIGPLPVAYTLLGIACGALAGLLLRRTVRALSVTLLGMAAFMALFARYPRMYLWPVLTRTGPQQITGQVWPIQEGVVTAGGERVTAEECFARGFSHSPCAPGTAGGTPFTDYHPGSHLWPLQLMETGIVLVLAAVAGYAALRALRRLHG